MKRLIKLILVLCIVFLFGCASSNMKYLPAQAFKEPKKGLGIPHFVELERVGIKTIVTFEAVMDPGLWVEIIQGGGVWPSVALTKEGKIINGYAFLSGITPWGDFTLRNIFISKESELNLSRAVILNRDAGYAFSLFGQEIITENKSKKSDISKKKYVQPYDVVKFDKDEMFRKKFLLSYGTNLQELNSFWEGYYLSKMVSPPRSNFLQVIKVHSNEYENLVALSEKIMPYQYKMGNGEIFLSFLPEEIFKRSAVESNGFTGAERFVEKAKIPVSPLLLTGADFGIIAGISLIKDAVIAGIDDDWHGAYARSKSLRYELAPLFRRIALIYKDLLSKRDQYIKDLRNKIETQEILRSSN